MTAREVYHAELRTFLRSRKYLAASTRMGLLDALDALDAAEERAQAAEAEVARLRGGCMCRFDAEDQPIGAECSLHRQMREGLQAAEERCERLRAALGALVGALHEVHADPRYAQVWAVAQTHCGPYAGRDYVTELAGAEAALLPDPPQEG